MSFVLETGVSLARKSVPLMSTPWTQADGVATSHISDISELVTFPSFIDEEDET